MSCLFLPCFLLENHLPPGFLSLNNTILPVGSTTNLLHEVPSLIPRCCRWPTSWSGGYGISAGRFFPPIFFGNLGDTLQETNISPPKWHFEDDYPFPKVGYVNPLEGTSIFQTGTWCVKLFWNWNLLFFEGGGGHRCIFLFITVLFFDPDWLCTKEFCLLAPLFRVKARCFFFVFRKSTNCGWFEGRPLCNLPAEFSADMCTLHFFEHGCFILLGKV